MGRRFALSCLRVRPNDRTRSLKFRCYMCAVSSGQPVKDSRARRRRVTFVHTYMDDPLRARVAAMADDAVELSPTKQAAAPVEEAAPSAGGRDARVVYIDKLRAEAAGAEHGSPGRSGEWSMAAACAPLSPHVPPSQLPSLRYTFLTPPPTHCSVPGRPGRGGVYTPGALGGDDDLHSPLAAPPPCHGSLCVSSSRHDAQVRYDFSYSLTVSSSQVRGGQRRHNARVPPRGKSCVAHPNRPPLTPPRLTGASPPFVASSSSC